MKRLSISEFRKQCLSLVDSLPEGGVVITKRGRPVARLLPYRDTNADLIGSLAGQLKIKGNLFSTGEQWNAES